MEPRNGEKIGGGHFVFRRDDNGRVKPSRFPFEYPSREAADAEARRLAESEPGSLYVVLAVAYGMIYEPREIHTEEDP